MNQTFFPTQKTVLSAKALKKEVLSKYQLPGPLICKLRHPNLKGNQVYLVKSNSSKYYLCAFKHQLRTTEEIEKEIEQLSSLTKQGNQLNKIVPTIDGSSFLTVNAPEGKRYLALFKILPGPGAPAIKTNNASIKPRVTHISTPFFPVQESRLSIPDLIKNVIKNYDIDLSVDVKLVKGDWSDLYMVKSGSDIYWLKIYKDIRINGIPVNKESLQSVVDFSIDLNNNNPGVIEAVAPIEATDGSYIQTINAAEGDRHAILFNNASGDQPFNTVWRGKVTTEQFFQCGKAFAHFYNCADGLSTEYKRAHLDMEQLIDNSLKYIDPSSFRYQEDYEYIIQISKILKDKINKLLPKTKPEYGICHGDPHPGNVRVSKDKFIFLDFDNWYYGWRALEFALIQRARPYKGFFRKMQYNRQWHSFMKGYLKVRPFSENEMQTVPIFSVIFLIYMTAAIFSASEDNDTVVIDDFSILHSRVNQIKHLVKMFKIC